MGTRQTLTRSTDAGWRASAVVPERRPRVIRRRRGRAWRSTPAQGERTPARADDPLRRTPAAHAGLRSTSFVIGGRRLLTGHRGRGRRHAAPRAVAAERSPAPPVAPRVVPGFRPVTSTALAGRVDDRTGGAIAAPDGGPRRADMPHCEFLRPPSMGAVGHVLVFTFPGQGSQRAGMGAPWVDHPSWEVVEEASAAADRDLSRLLLHAPIEELTQTENAELATTVLSLVVLDAVERIGLTPAACAGHSLGEYTALVASGSLGFDHGIQLVVARGEAMARAGEEAPGTMAALLGIADDDAEAACMRAEGDVWVANYNAPGQVVIAGTADAVALAGELAKGLGAKRVMPIPVSGAFHTPLMQGARADLRKALAEVTFLTPEVRVVANVDAHVHDDPADWPGLLSAQLCSPVRWRQTLETFAGLGLTSLVELGRAAC